MMIIIIIVPNHGSQHQLHQQMLMSIVVMCVCVCSALCDMDRIHNDVCRKYDQPLFNHSNPDLVPRRQSLPMRLAALHVVVNRVTVEVDAIMYWWYMLDVELEWENSQVLLYAPTSSSIRTEQMCSSAPEG